MAGMRREGRNTPPHPEHGSYVIGCTRWSGREKEPCKIDWHDPSDEDEFSTERSQCVHFWCETCAGWKLCSTWHRSGPYKRNY
jgi:hypothetical protein